MSAFVRHKCISVCVILCDVGWFLGAQVNHSLCLTDRADSAGTHTHAHTHTHTRGRAHTQRALQYRANISGWKACTSLLSSKLCRLCWWMKSSECKMLSNLPPLTALLLVTTLHLSLHFPLLPCRCFLPSLLSLHLFAYCIAFSFFDSDCFILKCGAAYLIKDKLSFAAFSAQWHMWRWWCYCVNTKWYFSREKQENINLNKGEANVWVFWGGTGGWG